MLKRLILMVVFCFSVIAAQAQFTKDMTIEELADKELDYIEYLIQKKNSEYVLTESEKIKLMPTLIQKNKEIKALNELDLDRMESLEKYSAIQERYQYRILIALKQAKRLAYIDQLTSKKNTR